METLSKNEETRVITALKSAIEVANTGVSPSAAIEKIATAEKFSPEIVKRMTEAFNTSKTLKHLKTADAKAESFSIADAATILQNMYPETVATPREKAASTWVPAEYDKPAMNHMKKAAHIVEVPKSEVKPYADDPNLVARRVLNKRAALKGAAAVARTEYYIAYEKLQGHLKSAADHFRLVSHEPFADYERRVQCEFGDSGEKLLPLIYKMANVKRKIQPLEKRSSVIFPLRSPYIHTAAAVEMAQDMVKKAKIYQETKAAMDKEAGLGSLGAAGVLKSMVPQSGGGATMGEPDRVLDELYDPEHETEMRGIKSQAMLSEFLSDDPIISGYDEDTVLKAYNDLSSMTPYAAQDSNTMRGMLRRVLQESEQAPNEVLQSIQIEKGLRDLDQQ